MAPEILYRVIYGTSTPQTDPQKSYLASSLTILPALLKDFSRRRVIGADYPGIIPQRGHSVKGTIVSGLTTGDIYRLDKFEGDEYSKRWVDVIVQVAEEETKWKEELRRVQTYVYVAGIKMLEEREWDYDEFRREKLGRWTGSSKEYRGLLFPRSVLGRFGMVNERLC